MFFIVSKEVHTRAYKKAHNSSEEIHENIIKRLERYHTSDDLCFDPKEHNKYVDKEARTVGCGCKHCRIKKQVRDLNLYIHRNKHVFEEKRLKEIKQAVSDLRIELRETAKRNNIMNHICLDA